MKVGNSETYKVRILKDVTLTQVCNYDEDFKEEVEYDEGTEIEVEICELDKKANTVTFYFNAETEDEEDSFIRNVPISCFEPLKKKVVTWEEIA